MYYFNVYICSVLNKHIINHFNFVNTMAIEVPVVKTYTKSFNRNRNNFSRNGFAPKQRVAARDQVPALYRALVSELNYNADIRRYCSLYIIKSFKDAGIIPAESKAFVKFMWNKFTVKCDNLEKDYTYGEEAFIKGYAAANRAVLLSGLIVLNAFTINNLGKELTDIVTQEEINACADEILKSNTSTESEEEEVVDEKN